MKRVLCIGVVALAMIMAGYGSTAAGEWRVPFGISYISGVGEIVDLYEDNLDAEGYTTDSADGIPIGISVHPYYEFDFGLGIGIGIGPMMMIIGDADFFNLPVNACLRFAFMPRSNTSLYLRAGASYNIASGDYVEDSEIGYMGAIGIEFMRHRTVSLGIEAGVNNSTIEFEDLTTPDPDDTEEIEPLEFTASIFAVF